MARIDISLKKAPTLKELTSKLSSVDNGADSLPIFKKELGLTLGKHANMGGIVDDNTHGETPRNTVLYVSYTSNANKFNSVYLLTKKDAPDVMKRFAKGNSFAVVILRADDEDNGFADWTAAKSLFSKGCSTYDEAIQTFSALATALSKSKKIDDVLADFQ